MDGDIEYDDYHKNIEKKVLVSQTNSSKISLTGKINI